MGGPRRDDPRPCAVYRCFAVDSVLLYIGRTVNPERRWREQERWTPWGLLVASHTVEWYPSVAAAMSGETRAIEGESPLLNRAGQFKTRRTRTLEELATEVRSPDGEIVPLLHPGMLGWLVGEEAISKYRQRIGHLLP